MKWDRTLEKIKKQTSEQTKYTEEEIQEAVELLFSWLHRNMQSEDMPRVLLHNFGTFYPLTRALKKSIKLKQEKIDHNVGNVEKLKSEVEMLQKVLDREIGIINSRKRS